MKNKQILKISLMLLAVIAIVFGIYFINNYNQFHAYVFQGNDASFHISGSAVFTKQVQRLHIDRIKYKEKDILIKKIKISLVANIEDKERLIYASEKKSDTLFSLADCLDRYSYGISEQYGYDDYFNSTIIRKFQDVMYLKIEWVNETDQKVTKMIQLDSEKYSNNQWFYKNVNHL